MAELTGTAPKSERGASSRIGAFMRATEVDTHLVGMVAALAIVWIGFQFASAWRTTGNPFDFSAGVFLTPRNLWNLSVQTSAVAVMATGMVLVIVTRNIDLSVGSLMAVVGMIMGALQVDILPQLGIDPWIWAITLAVGLVLGGLIGAFQGYIIAYLGVPSFIVTLGGYLVWRGAAWWVASGQTIAPLDANFQLIGGGAYGSIGATWSWVVGAAACLAIIGMIVNGRRQRRKFSFPLRPLWAEILLATIGCGAVLISIAVLNAYPWPVALARQYAEENGIAWPEDGLFISLGIAIPVLIALGVAILVHFLARRTRFGRYVFAIGGNPEAARLAGVPTRWIILKVFALMGVLCAIAAAISTARLNAATNALGNLNELYTIAAAVIGGTSLSGGIGTIPGAMVGALVMQSLQSGMVLLGLDAPLQNIVVGVVLVIAVWLDTIYRQRAT
jgi:D-xylose transport system permease protein